MFHAAHHLPSTITVCSVADLPHTLIQFATCLATRLFTCRVWCVVDSSITLQAFESELKKYMAIEQEISQVAPMHNIGSLALETQPLKYSLKSEAASWKAQYAKNLHKQGSEELKAFDQYMRDTTLKLNRKVEDLEDVRFIMGVLKEVTNSLWRLQAPDLFLLCLLDH